MRATSEAVRHLVRAAGAIAVVATAAAVFAGGASAASPA